MQFNKYHDKLKESNNQVHNRKHLACSKFHIIGPRSYSSQLHMSSSFCKYDTGQKHSRWNNESIFGHLNVKKKGTLEETSNSIVSLEIMTDMTKWKKNTWLLEQTHDLWQHDDAGKSLKKRLQEFSLYILFYIVCRSH